MAVLGLVVPGLGRARKDHTNIRSLQKSISGLSLTLGLGARM